MSSYTIGTYVEIFRDGKWNAAVILDLEDSFDDGEILVKFIENGKTEWIRPNSKEVREIENPTRVLEQKPEPNTVGQPQTELKKIDENQLEIKSSKEPQLQLLNINEGQLPGIKPSEHSLTTPVNVNKGNSTVLKEKIAPELPLKFKYQVGDNVIAAWSKSKNQPARIEAILPNNDFRVQFDDGFRKVVSIDQLTKEADIMPDPSYPKYSTRHKNIDFNSLQNTEEIRHKKKKKKSKHKYKFNFKLNKSITPSEESPKNEIVIQAEVHNEPESIENIKVEPKPKEIFDPSESFVLVRKTGERQQTVPVHDPRLPPGWFKHKTYNQNRWTAFIINNEGKKFFGRKSLSQYFKNRNIEFPEEKFSFSYILDSQPRRRRSSKFNTEKKIKTLAPLVQSDETNSRFSDLNSSLDSEGNYTCPKDECRKKFRKESLLMMHLKHYHPEYKNMLPPTPNVADLAFARTNNMDTTEEHPRLSKKRDSGGSSEYTQVSPLKSSLTPVKLSPTMPLSVEKNTESPTTTPDFNSDLKKSFVSNSIESKENDSSRCKNQSLEDFDIECQIAQFEIVKKTCEVRVKYGQNNPVTIPVVPEIKESTQLNLTPPSSMKLEKMKKEEVVNCVCGVMEEDGLMIMCELCLCWQHAHCFNIESDDDVPERYICNICKHPPLQRKSLMYAYDEDWLKKGTLHTLDANRQYDEEFLKTQKILCKSHSLTGNLCKISNALHDASIKVQIVQEPNHPKLYLWDQCIKPEDQNDIKVEGPIIPKPEAPIDNQQCRLNLLNQVEKDYDLMEKSLDELELQLNALETDSSSLMGDPANDKPTLQMLLRDLETLRNLAIGN